MSLADLTAAQLAQKIAAGETTATDAVNDCLTRIEAREGTVGAWAHLDPVFARRQAEKLDAVRASGAALGPLHGVPVGIKDIIDTDDLPTEYGTVLKAGHRPFRDATVVARLKAAGAIIMGKTVTTIRMMPPAPPVDPPADQLPRLPPVWCLWPSGHRPTDR